MFSYVFCDGMKLIRDAIRLPFTWPYGAVMGLWLVLLSKKPSSTSRVVRQQIDKAVFNLFNFYVYIIFGVGEGGSKNYQEIKRGAELILLLRTDRGGVVLHNNFPSSSFLSLPLLIIIAQSLTLLLFLNSFANFYS